MLTRNVLKCNMNNLFISPNYHINYSQPGDVPNNNLYNKVSTAMPLWKIILYTFLLLMFSPLIISVLCFVFTLVISLMCGIIEIINSSWILEKICMTFISCIFIILGVYVIYKLIKYLFPSIAIK